MSHGLNDILNKRFLVLEICLKLKDALVAAVILVTITLLAFSAKGQLKKATLGENGFDSHWLIQEIRVVAQEDYWLRNSLTIVQEPPVAHASLLSTRLNIHDTSNEFSAYAKWPCELLTIMRARNPGPCAFSKAGIILSVSCGNVYNNS
jgi:hypothetical protein